VLKFVENGGQIDGPRSGSPGVYAINQDPYRSVPVNELFTGRHQESHEAAHQRNLDILERARKSREGYDGENTREAFRAAVKAAFNGNEPRKFQLDVAEAMTLGLDSTVIAGTGSGKTLPWAIPLLMDENKDNIVLVISPLKALQTEHVMF
jgi:ATP-dependent helicase YprA (DUF1998 family)